MQRGLANTGVTDPSTISLTSATTSESFVVLGGMFNNGTGWGNNEFVRAQLVDAQTLDLRTNVAGTQVPWQVVDMVGVRAAGYGVRNRRYAATGHDHVRAIWQHGPRELHDRQRERIAAAALTMQTALSDSSNDFPASTETWVVPTWTCPGRSSAPFCNAHGIGFFAAAETTQSASVTGGITASTSVAFSGSQALLGASTGSTDYNGPDVDLVGEAARPR